MPSHELAFLCAFRGALYRGFLRRAGAVGEPVAALLATEPVVTLDSSPRQP